MTQSNRRWVIPFAFDGAGTFYLFGPARRGSNDSVILVSRSSLSLSAASAEVDLDPVERNYSHRPYYPGRAARAEPPGK